MTDPSIAFGRWLQGSAWFDPGGGDGRRNARMMANATVHVCCWRSSAGAVQGLLPDEPLPPADRPSRCRSSPGKRLCWSSWPPAIDAPVTRVLQPTTRWTGAGCSRLHRPVGCVAAARRRDLMVTERRQEVGKRAFPWTSRERFPSAPTVGDDLGERRRAQRFPVFC